MQCVQLYKGPDVGSAFLEKICATAMHTTEAAMCCHLIIISLFSNRLCENLKMICWITQLNG